MPNVKEEQNLDINETIGKAESYVQENKKSLSVIGVGVLVIIAGYFVYTNMIVAPQEKDAEKDMFMAEQFFAQDSFKLALNGDKNKITGFLDIIDNYGSSNSANLAKYYAGICYLKTGDNENAIKYLSDYDAEDDVTGALAFGGIGDANLELGKKDEALKFYKKAMDWDKNQFTVCIYSMKAAMVYELNGDYQSAVDLYEKIKKDYPTSTEAREVDRYIARDKAMVSK